MCEYLRAEAANARLACVEVDGGTADAFSDSS
jgi:hypothetical protein